MSHQSEWLDASQQQHYNVQVTVNLCYVKFTKY